MRDIQAATIAQTVARLAQQANFELSEDMLTALKDARARESSQLGHEALGKLIENARVARLEGLPLCQDCGAAVVFLEIGQEVHINNGCLNEAIAEGVRRGYQEGYLRKSMVACPFSKRVNTGDNTPPIIHTEIVPGEKLKISFLPKGGGAENMSRLFMLKPAAGEAGIVDAVVATVREAGGNPCPPLIIGLGIGATSEKAMIMAKKVLLRPVGYPSPDPEVAGLEKKVLAAVNTLGIGPLGLGGTMTALAVQAETRPCHFASLPLAVNLQCHSARHAEAIL
jgi:fumarate hydratase subunit alpha